MAQQRATGPALPIDLTILVAPGAQTSTNSYAEVTGSRIDTHTCGASSVAFRIAVATNTLDVKICGSLEGTTWTDLKCFTLDGLVQDGAAEQTITAGNAIERHVGALSGYRHYAVFIKADVGGSQGTATVTGFAKAGLAGQSVSATSVTVGAALPAGDNNVGNVDVLTIAAGDNNIGNVDIASAIPAGTNNVGDVDVASLPTQTPTIAAFTTTTNDWTYVTGSKIDTGGAAGGQRYVGYRAVVTVNDLKLRVEGSFDDSIWDALTCLDEAGADQAGSDLVVASGATEHFRVAPGRTAKGDANVCYRYYRMVADPNVDDTHGTVTVKAFAK